MTHNVAASDLTVCEVRHKTGLGGSEGLPPLGATGFAPDQVRQITLICSASFGALRLGLHVPLRGHAFS